MVVTAGNVRIDNKKFKKRFGFGPRMLNFDEAYVLTGLMVGGVCPFALPVGIDVYLDVSLKYHETVFPACGNSHSMIEVTCDQLFEYSGSSDWVDVCGIVFDE